MDQPLPTAGRIVHFFAQGMQSSWIPDGTPLAAIVTGVDPLFAATSCINLAAFGPECLNFRLDIRKAEYYGQPGRWDWPPRQ